jgi:hypothetical protein
MTSFSAPLSPEGPRSGLRPAEAPYEVQRHSHELVRRHSREGALT